MVDDLVLVALAVSLVGCTELSTSEQDVLLGVHYIATNGVDHADCAGGTRTAPWKTWQGQLAAGCIKPGTTIYFMAGTYTADGGTFAVTSHEHLRFGIIPLPGDPMAPVRLERDPEAPGDWPVRFAGLFWFDGGNALVKGIEFDASGIAPLTKGVPGYVFIGASDIAFKGNSVHGDLTSRPFDGPGFDCIKIVGGDGITAPVRSENIRIVGNQVSHCVRDCIDVTGSRGLLYRDNTFHECGQVLIKGGTEDVIVEENTFTAMAHGVFGSEMRSNVPGVTTGSPVQATLPISERFVAKNIVIRNNIFAIDARPQQDDSAFTAIGANGWRDVLIQNNTIAVGTPIAMSLGDAGFDFRDPIARAYCEAHPTACGPCKLPGEPECWYIALSAKNVRFENNIVGLAGGRRPGIQAIHVDLPAALDGFTASNNIYFNPVEPVLFQIEEQAVFGLSDSPFESGSFEADPELDAPSFNKVPLSPADWTLQPGAFAIDRGLPNGLTVDFWARPRDATPDVGAFEAP